MKKAIHQLLIAIAVTSFSEQAQDEYADMRGNMSRFYGFAATAIALIALTGCAGKKAADAQTQLIGLTRADIMSCMGPPSQRGTVEGVEVWSYAGGGQTVGMVSGGIFSAKSFNCAANLTFTGDRVSSVRYAGNTGRPLSPLEACDGLVQACVK